MIQYAKPVRNNTPQQVGPYTYRDENNVVISLTAYISVSLEVKQQGQLYAVVSGIILSPATNGQVQVNAYTFLSVGIWDIQFVCTDGSGNRLFGEPLQVTVVPNVEDLTLNQLPVY